MQELNEDDGEFIHRRLKDYLSKNPDVNESLSNLPDVNAVSPNLPSKTPKSQTGLFRKLRGDSPNLTTPKAPTALKTK